MNHIKDTMQDVLAKLAPDQQAFARHVAEQQVQNRLLVRQIADMKAQYDDLWKVMIVVLDACGIAPGGKELRIHESQFLRFKEEYRIDRTFDASTREVVIKLLTVFDEPTAARVI